MRLPAASLLAFLLLAHGAGRAAGQTTIAPPPPGWSEPANIAAAEAAATAYHESGRYGRDLAAVDAAAAEWIVSRVRHVARPALVLDIDETALSNWDEEQANGYGYFAGGGCDSLPAGPCGFTAWERSERAPALAPTLALFRRARMVGVAVFFVTGRKQALRAVTAATLEKAGYAGWTDLLMEPDGSRFVSAADFKAPARASIEARGYTVLATVGDQRSDLDGGHAERGFLLPNPFYFIP